MDRRRYSLFVAAPRAQADGAPTAEALLAAGPVCMAVSSFDTWRDAARALLQAGVAPDGVQWCTSAAAATYRSSGGTAAVPRALLAMFACAACCRVDERWSLLYRVLWRRQCGDAAATAPADPDGARLRSMVATVRAEMRRVRGTIRFLERPPAAGAPRFIGWCEPAHDILGPLARHFRERLACVTWMIATPDASVLWDGAALHHGGPPLRRARAGGDSEAPWLAYYRDTAAPRDAGRAAPPITAAPAANLAVPTAKLVVPTANLAVPAAKLAVPTAKHAVPASTPAGLVSPPAPGAFPLLSVPASASGSAPATLAQCRRCSLWEHATQPVGGMGAAPSAIMLVGEQPGDREDVAGLPFVGPAGMLLDRALAEAGLDRQKVYITNAVKHFKWTPRGKRRLHKTPAQREVAACRYWFDAELSSVRPKVVVALGGTALKAVLDDPGATLKELVGSAIGHGGRWVVATYHPAYVLRLPDPAARQQAFAALVDALRRAQVLVSAHPAPAQRPSQGRSP